MCTSTAIAHGLCSPSEAGLFIVNGNPPPWSVRQQQFDFGAGSKTPQKMTYAVNRTGYYCMGAASVSNAISSSLSDTERFSGHVEFHNRFRGHLPASEHPNLWLYSLMMLVYFVIGGAWAALCWQHREQLVPVQHYISGMIGFLVLDMICEWMYYKYFNSHTIDMEHFREVSGSKSVTAMARFLLVVINVMDSAQSALSLFLLLIVSMGYGVVRPTIGNVIYKVFVLTGLHFGFGVLYSVGIIMLLLGQNAAWTFSFIFPLAGTLTAFLTWILHSLRETINDLTERRQAFKCAMFKRLNYILLGAVVALLAYFFVAMAIVMSYSATEVATHSWKYRWFLLDGSLVLVYAVAFVLIAWVWRPTGQNMRLAMSDELATEDHDAAGAFEVPSLASHDLDDDAVEVESVHLSHLSHVPASSELPAYNERLGHDDLVFDAEEAHQDGKHDPVMDEPYELGDASFDDHEHRKFGSDAEREHLRLSEEHRE